MSATKRPRWFPKSMRAIGIAVKREKPGAAALGHWKPSTGEIVISPKLSKVETHIVFVHELLHAVDDAMMAAKLIRRRSDHNWIENASCNLVLALVEAGVYRHITPAEVRRFARRRAVKRRKP